MTSLIFSMHLLLCSFHFLCLFSFLFYFFPPLFLPSFFVSSVEFHEDIHAIPGVDYDSRRSAVFWLCMWFSREADCNRVLTRITWREEACNWSVKCEENIYAIMGVADGFHRSTVFLALPGFRGKWIVIEFKPGLLYE